MSEERKLWRSIEGGKERKLRKTRYTKHMLNIDVEWLIGQGVDETEAEPFIKQLLNSKLEE